MRLLADDHLDQAEAELKKALSADLFFGPAHNNLGTLYYRQKKLYRAAWEFQYASKLMPGRSQPLNNLGMVFEAVTRLDEAAEWYEKALKLDPDSPQVIGNLARCRIRQGQRTPETRRLLLDLVLKDTRPEWVRWAHIELAKTPAANGPPPPSPTSQQAEPSTD